MGYIDDKQSRTRMITRNDTIVVHRIMKVKRTWLIQIPIHTRYVHGRSLYRNKRSDAVVLSPALRSAELEL
eukprot:scaffold10652_cov127-Skeletonema_marinoi.AAC.2